MYRRHSIPSPTRSRETPEHANQVRGDVFLNVDMGLSKRLPHALVEKPKPPAPLGIFNITNTNRFDVQSIAPSWISFHFGNTPTADQPARNAVRICYEF